MELYVCGVLGVYPKDVLLITDDLTRAVEFVDKVSQLEFDDYHAHYIEQMTLNKCVQLLTPDDDHKSCVMSGNERVVYMRTKSEITVNNYTEYLIREQESKNETVYSRH